MTLRRRRCLSEDCDLALGEAEWLCVAVFHTTLCGRVV